MACKIVPWLCKADGYHSSMASFETTGTSGTRRKEKAAEILYFGQQSRKSYGFRAVLSCVSVSYNSVPDRRSAI